MFFRHWDAAAVVVLPSVHFYSSSNILPKSVRLFITPSEDSEAEPVSKSVSLREFFFFFFFVDNKRDKKDLRGKWFFFFRYEIVLGKNWELYMVRYRRIFNMDNALRVLAFRCLDGIISKGSWNVFPRCYCLFQRYLLTFRNIFWEQHEDRKEKEEREKQMRSCASII